MPHINRLRVNNVKYNFGTQSYEDFVMKPFCRNTLYDLANGGGKSVLMLLLLQNVIPNCTLDEKQPVEKLFRTGDGSQTIHSLIEWRLDEPDVTDGFKYMTTGFCARKAQQTNDINTGRDTASIEYFNYCIFYRSYNENDIRNLPLVKNGEKITYQGLKKYLKELEHDNSLVVKIFDRKGEYQAFISEYGLYESEWEIIRGINKTEGHVRTYFESNYKTTRKVVEDLLIEEIIQKSFRGISGEDGTGSMSKTLLDMKDKLAELSKKRGEIENFEKQIEVLDDFALRLEGIADIYMKKAGWEKELIKTHRQAAQNCNILTKKLEENDRALEETAKKETELAHRIDAAKLYADKKTAEEIKKELDKTADEAELIKKEIDEAGERLAYMESSNDYLEYVEEKKKRDEVSETVYALENKNGGILSELKFLAWHKHERMKEHLEKIKNELSLLSGKLSETIKQLEEEAFGEREVEKELAVLGSRTEQLEEERSGLAVQLSALKADAGIMFAEAAGDEASRAIESLSISMSDNAMLKNEIEKSQAEYKDLHIRIIKNEQECLIVGKELEECKKEVEIYEGFRLKADKLTTAYGTGTYEGLLSVIRDKRRTILTDTAMLHNEAAELKELADRLKAGEIFTDSKDVKRLVRYINRPGAGEEADIVVKAEEGSGYINRLGVEDKEYVLKSFPYIVHSVVVSEGFEAVCSQAEHLGRNLNAAVPVISGKMLDEKLRRRHEAEEGIALSGIFIAAKNLSVYLEPAKRAGEIERLEESIAELDRKAERNHQMELSYAADEDFVHGFIMRYNPENPEPVMKAYGLAKKLEALNNEGKKLTAALRSCENICNELAVKLEASEIDIENANIRIECLKEIAVLFEKQLKLEEKQKNSKNHEEALRKKLIQYKQKLEKLHTKKDDINRQIAGFNDMVKETDREWNSNYAMYFEEGEYGGCTLKDDELDAAFLGKRAAMQQEHSELDDKKRLVNSYVNAMNYCLKNISRRGTSVAALAKDYEEHRLHRFEESDTEQLRDKLIQLDSEYRSRTRAVDKLKEDYVRLDGKTTQAKLVMQEKYGEVKEFTALSEDVNTLIKTGISEIGKQTEIKAELAKEKQKLDGELAVCSEIKKDIERILRALDKAGDIKAGEETPDAVSVSDSEKLKAMYESAASGYEAVLKEIEKRKREFEKNREQLIEKLKGLGALPLADEVKMSVGMPENADETMRLSDNLKDVGECIRLEKERIVQSTKDMADIRANFESQCLQRCLNIKSELDRLPRLSRIKLDDEQIQMISLNIPYVKEEQYAERMADYIDRIVTGTESFIEQTEKLKFIRQSLSLKKLFSVIVTDMNAIKLSLYKRERIREQSRHLRYEEAVGSTGQSQGIYIQFLISLINYISSINSGRGDIEGLRKVIFIDNPFGAAKDTYIWEPIFELLKTNHVQLIVPARGTTPAITGRFDVNYVLGQRLVDGRQQTVVVDYRSEVDTREAEFVPLMYEQTTLQF